MWCRKLFAGIIVLIAVIMGILVNALHPEQLEYVIVISKFFDVMIPILAVGALIKYLCKCCSAKCCKCCTCNCKSCSSCKEEQH